MPVRVTCTGEAANCRRWSRPGRVWLHAGGAQDAHGAPWPRGLAKDPERLWRSARNLQEAPHLSQ